jgi:polyhydroxybutyrate depolymerase
VVGIEAGHSQGAALRALLLVLCALIAFAAPAQAETATRSIEIDGQTRRFLLHAPEGEGARPLVMAFHGNGGNARTMERMTQFSDLGDTEGFVVVYPMAAGRGEWRVYGEMADVRFAEAIVATLAAEGLIDPARVYGLGKSLGAQMTWRLACERPRLFAAIGLVAGGYPHVCGPERPPAIIFHGVRDEYLPYEGGDGLMALPAFAEAWGLSGCSETPTREESAPRSDAMRMSAWRCAGRTAVLYSFSRSGHIYPTIRQGGVDATAVMWRFFSETGAP